MKDKTIGQHLIIGIQGTELTKKTEKLLTTIQPGGIIFFESNIENKIQVKKLIKDIKSLLEIKPFITLDQEGGQVDRLRKICLSVPSLWGASKVSLEAVLLCQKKIIGDLQELGFNMNLAPVLDINSNPENPIIGTRSISNNPKTVSEYGIEIAKLYLKHNILPVVKHFPGHGDLNIDSHLDLPTLNKTLKELKQNEMIPFEAATKNNIPAVMIGHIQVPLIEKNRQKPASISKNIIQNLLRTDMKFKGLVLTDDITMKALSKRFKPKDAIKESILAGADMAIYSSADLIETEDYETTVIETYNEICSLYNVSEEFSKSSDKSIKNILKIKDKHLSTKSNSKNISVSDSKIYDITKKIVHWGKKDLFYTAPSLIKPFEIIYPITPKLLKEDLKKITKECGFKKVDLLNYPLNPTNKDITEIIKASIKYDRRVLITYDIAVRPKQKKLTEELFRIDNDLIVISVGLENDIELINFIKNYLCSYSSNYVSLLTSLKKVTEA